MKETNMEHYRSEIEAFISAKSNFGKSKADGTINHCYLIDCDNCDFIEKGMSCDTGTIKWLMSPYKPEPVLTAREKHFVECLEDGWLTKGEACNEFKWWEKKPRRERNKWVAYEATQVHSILSYAFGIKLPFITWEDEEAWAVEELRKLKVEGGGSNE